LVSWDRTRLREGTTAETQTLATIGLSPWTETAELLNSQLIMTTDTKTQGRQKIIVFLGSFILFGVTYYGHSITSRRIEVIEHGQSITTEVTKTSSKRTNKSYFVTIDNLERDGGENFGRYADINIGDTITVKYLSDNKYVVADGVKGYSNMIIFQYLCFGTSLILFFLPLLSWSSGTTNSYLTSTTLNQKKDNCEP
jgi:hypothetical protein